MEMSIAGAQLREALGEPGCPFCRLIHQAECYHIELMLREYVTDGAVRLGVALSRGMCAQHAWALQAAEQLGWQDGNKTATFYESAALDVRRILGAYSVDADAASRADRRRAWLQRKGRLGLWLARRLLPVTAATSLSEALSPQAPCPLCQVRERIAAMHLARLWAGLDDPTFCGALTASDGLCLPHLRFALANAPTDAAAQRLIEISRAHLDELLAHLQSYMDKHRWQDRPELRSPVENASWVRMVAYLAGEPTDDASEVMQTLRQRAAGDYRARETKRK